MKQLLAYTMKTQPYFRLVDCSMHLAISTEDGNFEVLRNNTGILYPKCTFDEGPYEGTGKVMIQPWIFVREDGSYGVVSVRREECGPDPLTIGSVQIFSSKDLVFYEECGFLKLADEEVRNPHIAWCAEEKNYIVEWKVGDVWMCGRSDDLTAIRDAVVIDAPTMKEACAADILPKIVGEVSGLNKDLIYDGVEAPMEDGGEMSHHTVPEEFMPKGMMIPGNLIEITDEQAEVIRSYFAPIYNTTVEPIACTVSNRNDPLPKAVLNYSDGSTAEKIVYWDQEALDKAFAAGKGTYEIAGTVRQKIYDFPFRENRISDPCVVRYQDKYVLSHSGMGKVVLYISDTLEGLADAEPIVVWEVPADDTIHSNTWAQEFHVIGGIPRILTTLGHHEWFTVQSVVLSCYGGDIADPKCWSAPEYVVKQDGTRIAGKNGISLDMTHIEAGGKDYVCWSGRIVHFDEDGKEAGNEPADNYIATIDPEKPWVITSDVVTLQRPQFGHDRLHQQVVEGPYALYRGDEVWVSFAGASTGIPQLYDIGLLRANVNDDLLDVNSWQEIPWPVVTKESVPGQLGPGHNSFVKDVESGEDMLVFHAVEPLPDNKNRRMGIRPVHWAKTGLPYLELTPERELAPENRNVTMTLTIE